MIEVYTKNITDVWFGAAVEEKRVFATTFSKTEQETLRHLLSYLPYNKPFEVASAGSTFAEEIIAALKIIYDGKNAAPQVCLATEHLPAYTRKVLQTVAHIPVGYVASYGGVAEAAGGGARAVGNVMANNPFAPIVPCHRVVSADFTLGGYSGGLSVKVELLKREQRGYSKNREIQVDDRLLAVFPVEVVLRKLG